jgi:hypothetical protein
MLKQNSEIIKPLFFLVLKNTWLLMYHIDFIFKFLDYFRNLHSV